MIEDLKSIIHFIQEVQAKDAENQIPRQRWKWKFDEVKDQITAVIRKHGECRKIHESQTENGTTAVFSWTDKEKSSD